jgi:hypothetical protein
VLVPSAGLLASQAAARAFNFTNRSSTARRVYGRTAPIFLPREISPKVALGLVILISLHLPPPSAETAAGSRKAALDVPLSGTLIDFGLSAKPVH